MANNRIRFSNNFVLKDEKVGINTTDPQALLDVGGELKVSGISTFSSAVNIDGDLQVDGTSTLGFTTASSLYVSGISTLELAAVSNLYVSGISTLSETNISTLNVSGVSTFTGIVTTSTDLYVGGDLYVQDNLVFNSFAANSFDITNSASIGGNLGIGTTTATENSKLTIQQAPGSQALDIGTDLKVSSSGAFNPKVTIGSSVGAASTEKMEISAVSRDNGLLEIANYGGNQLFSVSNDQSESAFSVYRYANYDNLSIASFENRNLFSVSPLGIITTYGALRVGTSITVADSAVYNELYGRLNVRAPFSTSTEYVSIVPKFSDKGALSFESPVGTALTDRGTQIFSISNNVDSSIFRVNDLNRQPIFEASASGNAGIGTTNPQAKLQVNGNLRVTSADSTSTEQIDINYYNNFEYHVGIETFTFVGGAISFDSPAGISTDGVSLFPASLFAITNDPTGNIFSVGGYYGFAGGTIPAIDVTQSGRVGIGTTNPVADFEIKTYATATGEFQIQNRMVFSETINPGIDSTTSIRLEPQTPGVSTYAPARGSLLFDGVLDQSLNGGQLVTVVNDNSSLFRINRFTGLSTTNVTGTRTIETAFEVSPTGNVGVGTSIPTSRLDVRGNANISGITTVGLGSTSNPINNSTMSFELTNNTTLTIRVKGTDGITRTGIVTLS